MTTKASFTQSSKGKGSKTYTFTLPLNKEIVRTYCSQNQLETMMSKYSQKITLTLLPPKEVQEGKENIEKSEKIWRLQAQGKNRQIMKSLASDMIERYRNIIKVINNILIVKD